MDSSSDSGPAEVYFPADFDTFAQLAYGVDVANETTRTEGADGGPDSPHRASVTYDSSLQQCRRSVAVIAKNRHRQQLLVARQVAAVKAEDELAEQLDKEHSELVIEFEETNTAMKLLLEDVICYIERLEDIESSYERVKEFNEEYSRLVAQLSHSQSMYENGRTTLDGLIADATDRFREMYVTSSSAQADDTFNNVLITYQAALKLITTYDEEESAATQQLDTVKSELAASQSEEKSLKEQIQTTLTHVADKRQEYEQVKEHFVSSSTEATNLKEADLLEQQQLGIKEHIEDMQKNVALIKIDLDGDRNRLECTRHELQQVESKILTKQTEKNELNDNVSELSDEVAAIRLSLFSLSNRLSAADAKRMGLLQELDVVQRTMKALEANFTEVHDHLQKAIAESQQLCEENERLDADLAASRSVMVEKQSHMQMEVEKLEKSISMLEEEERQGAHELQTIQLVQEQQKYRQEEDLASLQIEHDNQVNDLDAQLEQGNRDVGIKKTRVRELEDVAAEMADINAEKRKLVLQTKLEMKKRKERSLLKASQASQLFAAGMKPEKPLAADRPSRSDYRRRHNRLTSDETLSSTHRTFSPRHFSTPLVTTTTAATQPSTAPVRQTPWKRNAADSFLATSPVFPSSTSQLPSPSANKRHKPTVASTSVAPSPAIYAAAVATSSYQQHRIPIYSGKTNRPLLNLIQQSQRMPPSAPTKKTFMHQSKQPIQRGVFDNFDTIDSTT